MQRKTPVVNFRGYFFIVNVRVMEVNGEWSMVNGESGSRSGSGSSCCCCAGRCYAGLVVPHHYYIAFGNFRWQGG